MLWLVPRLWGFRQVPDQIHPASVARTSAGLGLMLYRGDAPSGGVLRCDGW